MHGVPVVVGIVYNAVAGGGGTLTSSYTPGRIIPTLGIGAVKVEVTTTKDQATSESVRIMDYTDPANPRQLRSDDNNDPPSAAAVEHTYSASTKTDLFTNLGGVVGAIAIEAKTTGGSPTSGDAVLCKLTMFDGPVR